MFKKRFGNKKIQLPPAPEVKAPRAKADIDKEYSELCARSGEYAFQVENLKEVIASINRRIKELAEEAKLSDEAAKRQEAVNDSNDPTSHA